MKSEIRMNSSTVRGRVLARVISAACLFGFASAAAFADAGAQLAEQFRVGDPETKVEILRQIADDPVADVAEVYAAALDYALGEMDVVGTNAELRDLVVETVRRIGEADYAPARPHLWQLYKSYPDTTVRVAILGVLADLGTGDRQTVTYINEWLLAQNNLSASGTRVDLQVVEAAVDAVVELGNPSSIVPLLDTVLARHSQRISNRAETGMAQLATGNEEQLLEAVTLAAPDTLTERVAYLVDVEELSSEVRSRIAAAALDDAVRTVTGDATDRNYLSRLRSLCVQHLMQAEYSEATPAVIAHFNLTVAEYGDGRATKSDLVESIRAAGAMGTDAAAMRLAEYLELANTYTEYERPFDTRLVLETIAALRRIGSQEAYDDIYYVTLLDYPKTVMDAAREALASLAR